jgi:acyl-CoA thioester hydrolase
MSADRYPFSWPVRVYWEDTDAGGVVYHAAYVQFLERARTEWLRSAGIEQGRWRQEMDRVFAIRSMEVDFRAPARLDDALVVDVGLSQVRGASIGFVQRIRRPADETLLIEARVKAVCLRASDFRPVPIPAQFAALLRVHCPA